MFVTFCSLARLNRTCMTFKFWLRKVTFIIFYSYASFFSIILQSTSVLNIDASVPKTVFFRGCVYIIQLFIIFCNHLLNPKIHYQYKIAPQIQDWSFTEWNANRETTKIVRWIGAPVCVCVCAECKRTNKKVQTTTKHRSETLKTFSIVWAKSFPLHQQQQQQRGRSGGGAANRFLSVELNHTYAVQA